MRSIDIHAHLIPQCFWKATEGSGDWHGIRREQDPRGRELAVIGDRRAILTPKTSWTVEQRLMDMDSLGVDIHVVSPTPASTTTNWTPRSPAPPRKIATTKFIR